MSQPQSEDIPVAPTRPPIQLVTTDQGPRVGPYIFGKTLGTGSTGKVKLAKNLETDEIVAIKIVRKDYLDNKPSLKKKMRREISVLKVLSHPNLMSLIDVFEIETHLFLVMEFVDGLELFEYLVRRGALPLSEALGFFQQIICGLEYCHNRLICHRDLKPENLLLDRNYNIKIADFGMTSLNRPGKLLETSCGSPHYCDPMVVSGEKYDGLKADIWSCGVILYAMVTGRLPFDDDNIQRLLQKVQAGQYHLPSDLPKELRDLIRSMLTVDPERRISLKEIKLHPWFRSIVPRNYIEDHFVAPSEPIPNPDPMIIRSLIDLGWGDATFITGALAKPGQSMEKVFYVQLERHPMFHRSTVTGPTPTRDGDDSTTKVAAPVAVRPGPKEPVSDGDATKAGEKDDGTSVPSENGEAIDLSRKMGSVRLEEEGNATGEGGEEQSGGHLKRQSSLMREKELQATDGADNVDEVISSVTAGAQKSWFDSVRNYLTGQPEENESEKEGSAKGEEGAQGEGKAATG
eukprot:GFKZ01010582.1.p1 GENE.GFKZ01010582.1~~GFKZ01010582.1.p1  ORF type:complete len:538 (-),score=94.25 GFKZ01010582.1:516-2066(-)